VTKSDGRSVTRPGHTFTYTITVQNTGDQDLSDVLIEDPIPKYLSVTSIGQGGRFTDGKQNVIWSGISLNAGESKRFTFAVRVADNAPKNIDICNTVTARSSDKGLDDRASDCVKVEVIPQVAAVQVVSVPVTAKTGAGVFSTLATLMGAAGVALSVRRGQ
jgi:uncharacterized repeat protein (TIGR01451 family)